MAELLPAQEYWCLVSTRVNFADLVAFDDSELRRYKPEVK